MKLPEDIRFISLKYGANCQSCNSGPENWRAGSLVTIHEEGLVR